MIPRDFLDGYCVLGNPMATRRFARWASTRTPPVTSLADFDTRFWSVWTATQRIEFLKRAFFSGVIWPSDNPRISELVLETRDQIT